MALPAAATARWQQQRDCGSGGDFDRQWRRKLPDVTQWRRQAHNITIKYAAADNDGNGDGNNYNDDDEVTLTALVAVKGMTMKKDSGRQ